MDAGSLFTSLTEDELASLRWVSVVTSRTVIRSAHIKKLLAVGYVEESVTGLVLTDLGLRRLEQGQSGKDQH
jgi:hypothetical protein